MSRATSVAAMFTVCLAAACADDPAAPSSTADDPALTTELFVGSLDVGGSRFYSISVSTAGTVSVTLASLVPATAPSPASSQTVTLGFGVPAGTGCDVNASIETVPALIAQLSTESAAGIHCVRVSDPGRLAQAMNFAVRIVHP